MVSSLIGMAGGSMKPYRVHVDNIDYDDTGVIVLIALYFIEKDERVSRTKLEAYIFNWNLKGGRIQNFQEITDFMLEKGLIRIRGRSYFKLYKLGKELTGFFPMLVNIKKWMDKILQDYNDKTGGDTLSAV